MKLAQFLTVSRLNNILVINSPTDDGKLGEVVRVSSGAN